MNLDDLIQNNKFLKNVAELSETVWINDDLKSFNDIKENFNVNIDDIYDAEKRLKRYAPLIKALFGETEKSSGIIESEIIEVSKMKKSLEDKYNNQIFGKLLLKLDSHLPIAGSIKARGGIYEVLRYAEKLALENDLIKETDDYSVLASDRNKKFFSKYTIQVGSTGNLGLSIGIMSSRLGFKTIVHMSVDAKAWKKEMLRSYGVEVIEYETDYSIAVENGRLESSKDSKSYFVDDENSMNLFLGYSVAALRLKKQLDEIKLEVNKTHPLFVYLPCGIGGAPGGVAFGLKHIFGDNVHCFFVEPTHAPCMLVGMATKLHDKVSVKDFNIDGKTEADGLAVGRASKLVGKYMENMLSGIFTVDDYKLYDILRLLHNSENINIEPSACAAFEGVISLNCEEMAKYIKDNNLFEHMENSTHIAWATGGSLVPKEVMDEYLNKSKVEKTNSDNFKILV